LTNSDNIAEYILSLRDKGLANVSINSHIRVIRLIDIYEREFHKDRNLLKKVGYFPKEKRIPIILSFDELMRILSVRVPYVKRFDQNGGEIDRNRNLALWVITVTGCRLNECLSLRKCDIILGDKGYIKIERKLGFSTKNYSARTVPLPNSVINYLTLHLQDKKPENLAFTSATGKKLSATLMEDDWKRRLELAGITSNPHIHDLRATYITLLAKRKVPLRLISLLVGHKRADTTVGYMDFIYDDLWEAAKEHPMFAKSLTKEQKVTRLREWLEKIRIELEHDGDFAPPEMLPLNTIGYIFKAWLK
jgi:integrase